MYPLQSIHNESLTMWNCLSKLNCINKLNNLNVKTKIFSGIDGGSCDTNYDYSIESVWFFSYSENELRIHFVMPNSTLIELNLSE